MKDLVGKLAFVVKERYFITIPIMSVITKVVADPIFIEPVPAGFIVPSSVFRFRRRIQ